MFFTAILSLIRNLMKNANENGVGEPGMGPPENTCCELVGIPACCPILM